MEIVYKKLSIVIKNRTWTVKKTPLDYKSALYLEVFLLFFLRFSMALFIIALAGLSFLETTIHSTELLL